MMFPEHHRWFSAAGRGRGTHPRGSVCRYRELNAETTAHFSRQSADADPAHHRRRPSGLRLDPSRNHTGTRDATTGKCCATSPGRTSGSGPCDGTGRDSSAASQSHMLDRPNQCRVDDIEARRSRMPRKSSIVDDTVGQCRDRRINRPIRLDAASAAGATRSGEGAPNLLEAPGVGTARLLLRVLAGEDASRHLAPERDPQAPVRCRVGVRRDPGNGVVAVGGAIAGALEVHALGRIGLRPPRGFPAERACGT